MAAEKIAENKNYFVVEIILFFWLFLLIENFQDAKIFRRF
jgi:hypothetical protein